MMAKSNGILQAAKNPNPAKIVAIPEAKNAPVITLSGCSILVATKPPAIKPTALLIMYRV